jgi:hypothetical protein
VSEEPKKCRAALIKFKDDATPEDIAKALNSIRHILKVPSFGYPTDTMVKRPFRWGDIVHEYDPEWGEPVFYIP